MVLAASLVTSILAASKNLGLQPSVVTEVTEAVRSSTSCCNALTYAFNTKVSTYGQTVYKSSLTSYWSNQEGEIHPTCIIKPTSAQDVAKAIAILSIGAVAWGDECKFAVRGGGHSPFAGFANINNGVTIDLSTLNDVTVSADKSTVNIGPGARWKDVYAVLDEQGLSTQGGRVASVGVPGLVLGGGISFFSGRYGFVCDSVESYQVVLANGSIVNATATSYPDLFLALKGGANNFGVVTQFNMQTFKQGNFWGGNIGHVMNPYEYLGGVQAFAASPKGDENAALMSTFSFSQSQPFWLIISSLEYTKFHPAVVNPPVFSNFTSFPQIFNTMRVSNLSDFTAELDQNTPYGYRQLFATITIEPNLEVMQDAFAIANATALSLLARNITNLSFDVLYEPLPVSALPKTAATTNSLGLSKSNGNLIVILLDIMWSNARDDTAVHAATRNLISSIKSRGGSAVSDYLYLNYAGPFQNPLKGYGAASAASFQAASKKYDPNGMFQKLVPGGFKLPSNSA